MIEIFITVDSKYKLHLSPGDKHAFENQLIVIFEIIKLFEMKMAK